MTLRLLKSKDETFGAYKDFEAWANMQFNAKIKRLQSDHGGEFLGEQFSHHLCANGTERKLTMHDTPEHNSVAERLNHILVEQVCAVLHVSGLPKSLWGEAIMHMVWLKNQMSTQSLGNKTPYEMLNKNKPDLSKVPTWGCKVKVHDSTGSKLNMQAQKGCWVGFDANSDAHCVYWEDMRRVSIEQSVHFDKANAMIVVGMPLDTDRRGNGGAGDGNTVPIEGRNGASEKTNDQRAGTDKDLPPNQAPPPVDHLGSQFEGPAPLCCSNRVCIESSYAKRLHDGKGTTDGRENRALPRSMQAATPEVSNLAADLGLLTYNGGLDEDNEEVFAMVAVMADVVGTDPTSVEEARSRSDWSKWEEAMQKELDALEKAHTWTVVKCPLNVNVVGCKWVFWIKRDANSEINKYKAQLVAKGYLQVCIWC